MTVICEECGKVYHLDPEKIEKYKGKNIRVRCSECGHVTNLSKLIEEQEAEASKPFGGGAGYGMEAAEEPSREPVEEVPSAPPREERPRAEAVSAARPSGFLGLRGKMMLLFLVIPIILIALTGFFSQQQLNKLATSITEKSTDLVLEEGKEKLMQKARDVAIQCEIFLRNHPDLEREDFNYAPDFSGIAVQSVGETGYSCLIQYPEPERGQDWTIWAHPNPNIIGIDDIDMIRKALGPHFEQFWNVLTRAKGGKETQGFYSWKDPDGKIRDKYMAVAPIALEGKPYLLMTTAYIDEFTKKTDSLKQSAAQMSTNTRNINFGILIGAIIIIGLCITIYGYRITRNIQYLTEAADRISVGDLEAEIEVKAKDEIGSLADAISRMQDSLRFSIERLRRRR